MDITDEYIKENIYQYKDIYLRKEIQEISNKFELLFKTVKYLTNKELRSDTLTITGELLYNSHCICSCSKCKYIHVIEDTDTNVKFGVGSLCVSKFNNEKLDIELKYKKKPKCIFCNVILIKIYNEDGYEVNARRGYKYCVDCQDTRIYLNVPFIYKDKVKQMRGRFDFNRKQWYIYRTNPYFNYLISEYSNFDNNSCITPHELFTK